MLERIGVIIRNDRFEKKAVSIQRVNGSGTVFFGDDQAATFRGKDNLKAIVHTAAKKQGFIFEPHYSAEPKRRTKKTIKRAHGKGAHLMHRINNGRVF